MATKGQSKNCCCDGCSSPPFASTFDYGNIPFTEQHLCCACVPLQLRGAYRNHQYDRGICVLLTLGQACQNTLAENIWTGTLVIGEMVSDIAISLLPDIVHKTCYLVLSSTALGIVGLQIEIDDEMRSVMCSTCQDCANQLDVPFAVFDFDDPAYGAASLTLSRAANTSLTPTPLAPGCPDPCYGMDAQEDAYATCGGPCDGCGCLCTNATLYVQEMDQTGGGLIGTIGLTLCKNAYRSPSGWEVSVGHSAASSCCSLALTGFGSYFPTHLPDPTAIGVNTGNPCPNPTASWTFADNSNPYNHKIITASFVCQGCSGQEVGVQTRCCDQPISEALSCEVIISPPCMCPDLGDVDVLFDLIWNNNGNPGWSGTWSKDCGPPPFPYGATIGSIFVEVGCDAGGLTCRIRFLAVDRSNPDSISTTCDPFDGTFTFKGLLTGTECGGDGFTQVPDTATVKVMG
jgi:hypothetical protein